MQEYEKYESMAATISGEISSNTPNVAVNSGRKSKMPGKSGQPHQIDVVVKRDDLEVLIGCKRWNRRVMPSVVLELFGRLSDMGHMHGLMLPYNSNLRAAIATSKGISAGIQGLAGFFSIETGHAKSIGKASIKLDDLFTARIPGNANNYQDAVAAVPKPTKPEDS